MPKKSKMQYKFSNFNLSPSRIEIHFCECNPLSVYTCNSNSFCYWDGNSTCLSANTLTCDQIHSESQCAGSSARFQDVSCSWCESSGICMATKSFSNCVVCEEKSEVFNVIFIFHIYFLESMRKLSTMSLLYC